jgi:hypothetical protein
MTKDEVVRTLRAIRYNRPPTLTSIAQAAGVVRADLYVAIGTGRLSDEKALSLGKVLRDVMTSQVQIRRPPAQ